MKRILSLAALAALTITASAAPENTDIKPHFSPVGTLLMDGAVFASPEKVEFHDGVAMPDVRLGVIMTYGKWTAKIEAGYAYNKVGLKDVWMQYAFDSRNSLRLGLAMQHFGYQNSTAACMKVTMIEPISNTIFNEPHMLGIGYYHVADKFLATASLHAEPKAASNVLLPDGMSREGFGVRSRLVARPLHSDGTMLQAGISGAFMTPQFDEGDSDHKAFSFSANFPTKVTAVKAIGTNVGNAVNLWKLTPELMGCYRRIALESQYFWIQVNRRDALPAFHAYGAYATLRGAIIGSDYRYNMALAGIDTPVKGTLEGVASYNYTCLSDAGANIFGGRVSDVSCGLNYYFNKYITAKLRYSYTHAWDRSDLAEGMSLNAVQMRLQLIF